ncbi:MAG: DNA-directed RNA polymerase [Desulfurococcaceae archaeon]
MGHLYRVYKLKSVIRIPPEDFEKPLKRIAIKVLSNTYEGVVSKNLGVIIAVLDANPAPEGKVIHGDGASYHETEFTVLAFNPVLQEVVEGEVVTVANYGVFVDLGAVDGFIHRSQISEEEIEYDPVRPALRLASSGRFLEKGDVVRARIYNIAASAQKGLRISLTIRQPNLGKVEWLAKSKEKAARS